MTGRLQRSQVFAGARVVAVTDSDGMPRPRVTVPESGFAGRDLPKGRIPINREEVQRDIARRIGRTVDYMMQNLNQPLQVPVFSRIAGMSVSYFSLLFKRATGSTPLDYFIRARMRRACELLEDTRLSVKEVAALMGYDDPFYFSRLFKSVNSVAPREYRSMKTGIVARATVGKIHLTSRYTNRSKSTWREEQLLEFR